MHLPQILQYFPKIPLYLTKIPPYFPQISLYLPHIQLHLLKIQLFPRNTNVFVTMDLFMANHLGNMKLELSVLMLRRTVKGGHIHRLFPNVSVTAKYTLPCMLALVYLVVSSVKLVTFVIFLTDYRQS